MREWRVIPGFRRYEIARNGDIRVRLTGQARRVSDTGDRTQVWLVNDQGKGTTRNLGALVLLAYVGPPDPGLECSHLDGDYANNVLDNLAWETHAENMARKRQHGTVLAGDRHGKTKVTDQQALEIHRRAHAGERGADLAREFGISPQGVQNIKNGRRVVLRALA